MVLLSIEWLGNSGGLHSFAGSLWPKSQTFCDGYCDKLCIYHQQELLSWSVELCVTCVLMFARLFVNTRWLHLQIQVCSSVYCALQSCVADGIATYYLCVLHCITGTWLAPTDPHSKLGRGMVTCWQSSDVPVTPGRSYVYWTTDVPLILVFPTLCSSTYIVNHYVPFLCDAASFVE